jgi:hypothetical protein
VQLHLTLYIDTRYDTVVFYSQIHVEDPHAHRHRSTVWIKTIQVSRNKNDFPRRFPITSIFHGVALLASQDHKVQSVPSSDQSRDSLKTFSLYTQNPLELCTGVRIWCGLFLKLDITKAFDSVSSDYLMKVLQQYGFGNKRRGWISSLLNSSSTAILLNGTRVTSLLQRLGRETPFSHVVYSCHGAIAAAV